MDPFFILLIVSILVGVLFRIADQRRFVRVLAERDAKIVTLEARIAVLEPLAFIDVLTGIGNRRKFDDAIASNVAHAMRAEEPLVVLYLDLNGFKSSNDRFGHPFGDKLLRRVADAIADAIRPTDTVCRIGGDEFAVILVHCDVDGAAAAATRIARSLATNAVSHGDDLVHLSVSIGGTCLENIGGQVLVGGKFVGSYNEPGLFVKIPSLLCQGADNRLYVAKSRKLTESFPVEIS